MTRNSTLTQRIALEGGDAIREELKHLGRDGEEAFEQMEDAATETAKAGTALNRSLAETRRRIKEAEKAGKDFGNALKDAQKAAQTFAKRVSLVTAAVAALTTGFYLFVTSATEAIDEIGKTGQSLGLTIREFGRLQFAAEQAGVSTAQFETSIRTLAVRMKETSEGTGEALESFQRLGVRVADGSGKLRSTQDVLADLAAAFSRLPEGPERTALAYEIFGRAGTKLIPLLVAGREEMARLGDQAEELGRVFTEEQFRQAEATNDAINRTISAFNATRAQVGLLFAPAFEQAANTLTELLNENRQAFIEVGESVRDAVVPVLNDVLLLLRGRDDEVQNSWVIVLKEAIVGLAGSLQIIFNILNTVFNAIAAVLNNTIAPAINAIFGTELTGKQLIALGLLGKFLGLFRLIGAVITVLRTGFTVLSVLIGSVAAKLVTFGSAALFALELFTGLVSGVLEFLGQAGQDLLDFLAAGFRGVQEDINSVIVYLVAAFEGLFQYLQSTSIFQFFADGAQLLADVFNAALNFIRDLFLDLEGTITAIIDTIADALQSVIDLAREAAAAVASALGFSGGGGVGFARGGAVHGPGSTTSDSVPARLSRGEFVVRAAAVKKYGLGLMAAINGMKFNGVRGFAEGGLVGEPSRLMSAIPDMADMAGGVSGQPLNLSIGGETFEGLIAPEEVAAKLVRFATKSASRRAGRTPRWNQG